MKDVASLMNLAFKLTHEISEGALDLERLPELRQHGFFASQVADAGVSALAHVAGASASFSCDFRGRMDAISGVNGARECLSSLKRLLLRLGANGFVGPDRTSHLIEKIDETTVVLMALGVELRGGGLRARHAS